MFFNENSLLPFSGYLDPVTAIAGSAIIGGVMGDRASRRASRTTDKASRASIAEQRRQFDLSRADRAPYRAAGRQALTSLQDMMGIKTKNPYEAGTPEAAAFDNRQQYDFKATPGYEFRLGEGMKALERSQAGRRLGGRAAKEAMRYGQDYASSEFGNQFNRLSTLAGYGPASFDTGGPSGVPGTMERAGEAQAQAGLAGAGIGSQAIQGGLNNYMTWKSYNQPTNYGIPADYRSGAAAGDAYMPAATY